MKKAAALLCAAAASGPALLFAEALEVAHSGHAHPALRAHRHAAAASVPVPAAYTAWRPDPNELKSVLKDPFSALEKYHGTGRHSKKHGSNATDDDDDDFDLPADMFKPRVPKQTFTMDDASTILYKMLDEFGKESYLQFAKQLSAQYKLGDAKQAALVQSLRSDLVGFQKGGHDFMLDAALSTFPKLNAKQQRERLVEMLQLMLKNATTATPPSSAPAKKQPRGGSSAAAKPAAK